MEKLRVTGMKLPSKCCKVLGRARRSKLCKRFDENSVRDPKSIRFKDYSDPRVLLLNLFRTVFYKWIYFKLGKLLSENYRRGLLLRSKTSRVEMVTPEMLFILFPLILRMRMLTSVLELS